jgi:hypothetical protein
VVDKVFSETKLISSSFYNPGVQMEGLKGNIPKVLDKNRNSPIKNLRDGVSVRNPGMQMEG